MPRYFAERYDEEADDLVSTSFEAADDDQAVAYALREFGPEIDSVCRIPEGSGYNQLLWERTPTIALKFVADGDNTLDAVIATLEGFVSELKQLRDEGLTLGQPVDGGMIVLERPRPVSG